MELLQSVKHLAEARFTETVQIRRHLHQYPELSFNEHKTAAYIAQQLNAMGIEVKDRLVETGLVATIEGTKPGGKVVALRADIDALPIVEANEVSYKSKNQGVMHACGHDVHTASLLGAAWILQQLRDQFAGTVKLIFQPGEEKLPGGASLMIKAGALENPKPQSIIGQHVMPLIPAGKVGFREGMYMASADEIYFTVTGKGGHAAMPEFNIDPVLVTSHIIVALQQVISRVMNPRIPSVLSFGKVQANGATNVIPNQVHVEGTFRTMDEEWRAIAHEKMKHMAEHIATGMGATCAFEIKKGYPFLKNHPGLTSRARKYAEAYLGADNVVDLDLWMAAEDFSYYSQEMDACFYRLGTANADRGITSSVHTPTFDIDESALTIGTGLMAWLALEQLYE